MSMKEGSQGRRLGIGDHLKATPAETLGSYLLHSNCNEYLPRRSTSTLAGPDAPN
jgi:hypothetical protein